MTGKGNTATLEGQAPVEARPAQITTFRELVEFKENELRSLARQLMAKAGLSQAMLAKQLEVSQSSVSHMLTDRSYGLTSTEVSLIEALCKVPGGTLYLQAGFVEIKPIEDQVYGITGIDDQAAEAIVAAIQAVKANHLRKIGRP